MTAKEIEAKARRLIAAAKIAVDKVRRKLLMQEAFDLLNRANLLRQVVSENENVNRGLSIEDEAYPMWDGPAHLLSAETNPPSFFSDSAEDIAAASQQSLLDTEEVILRSEIMLARSRRLLEATAALRIRLAGCHP